MNVQAWRRDFLSFARDVLRRPDGASYGAGLDPWQVEDFEAALASPAGSVWWERPRGHSKTFDTAALALHHLLTVPGARCYFAAVDRDQAGLAHDSLRGFVRQSNLLAGSLRVDRWRVIAPSTDATLDVLAADAPGSWGLRPSLLCLDELSAWRGERAEEFLYALLSSLGKMAGARALVAATAGWDRSGLAWKLREAVQDDPAWVFSRRGQCASWISPAFLEQQRRLLPEHVFRMLHLNEWTEAGGSFLTFAEVRGIFDPQLRPVHECHEGRHVLALDLGLTHDATVAGVGHLHPGGAVEVHALTTWRGSPRDRVSLESVERWVVEAARRYSALQVQADVWQSVGLLQRLQSRGIACMEVAFTQQYRARLFEHLLVAVREAKIRAFPHQTLQDELLGLAFREVNGVLRVDHAPGQHDDHAIVLAMLALAGADRAGVGRLFSDRDFAAVSGPAIDPLDVARA